MDFQDHFPPSDGNSGYAHDMDIIRDGQETATEVNIRFEFIKDGLQNSCLYKIA